MILIKKNVSIVLILVFLGSCTFIGKKIIGYKPPHAKSISQHIKLIKKLRIDKYPVYELDTIYMKFLDKRFQILVDKKLFYQPLQVYYFDSGGTLVSFQNNCMFPGFPLIKWNYYYHAFDTFPPKNIVKKVPDFKFSFNEIAAYLRPINSEAKLFNKSSNILLVIYNKSLFKQSKNLVKMILENYKDENVNLIFCNNDLFLSQYTVF